MTKSTPKKPHPQFPLTPHPNGQWCKKIRGQIHYFGPWGDPNAAHQEYLRIAEDLHAGRQPRPSKVSPDGPTVKDVCNEFLNWQDGKVRAGSIKAATFVQYKNELEEFCSIVGKGRRVLDLNHHDFERYRREIGHLGVHSTARALTTIRSAFKYAYDSDLIQHPVKFGPAFKNPSAKEKRQARAKADQEFGKKLFAIEQVRLMVEKSEGVLKAAVLLGINGGFINVDCASLPSACVDFDGGLLNYARTKTAVQRVVPLWPETVTALKHAMTANRPKPARPEFNTLALLTHTGQQLVQEFIQRDAEGHVVKRSRTDHLGQLFKELLQRVGAVRQRIGFSALRHTFRTWADETKDTNATRLIMGHEIPGMDGVYIEQIGHERVRAVADHVRAKLFV